MKFWIDQGSTIYLFQVLKASGALEDYGEIRQVVKNGKVSVNNETAFKQRMELKSGDEVRYQKHHIIIMESDVKPEIPIQKKIQEKSYKSDENIKHGKIQQWGSKPLKSVLNIDKQISTFSRKLHDKFLMNKKTICFAESCTGGMVQEIITSYSGSSKYFLGGIVSYSDNAKINLLKVRSETVKKFGAVSKETAIEMLLGVQKLFQTDFAGIITGIAGPEGGTKEKPVGTVHLAVWSEGKIIWNKFLFSGNREMVRKKSVLNMFMLIFNEIYKK